MTRDERCRIEAATTERVLDEVEAFLKQADSTLWDGDQLNVSRCMSELREKLLSPDRADSKGTR